jgi:hypothetical protein
VSAGRGIQGGRGEIGACPGLRTSGRSSPWQKARRGSNDDGETGDGAARGGATGGGRRGWPRLQAQVAEGEVVASSTRDVAAESAARAAVTRRRKS